MREAKAPQNAQRAAHTLTIPLGTFVAEIFSSRWLLVDPSSSRNGSASRRSPTIPAFVYAFRDTMRNLDLSECVLQQAILRIFSSLLDK